MATLTGRTIAASYAELLKTTSASGITASLDTVQDGDATNSALQLSSGGVKSTGTLEVAGVTTATGGVVGDLTGDVTGNVTATSVLVDGVTATTQAVDTDDLTVATTAFVVAQVETGDTLAELNDVAISGVANANLLIYDGITDSKWENKGLSGDGTISNAGALTLAATNTNLTTLANVTEVGTITSGTWTGTAIANANLANSAITVGSTSISLGGTGATIAGLTLVTPALGTPASGVATNLTGTASGLTAGTVTTNANLTGEVTSSGNAATIADDVVDEANLKADNSPTNDYVLTAKSSASGGLTWASPTVGDITGVTAGTNLSGGGTSGTVTLNLDNPVVANLTGNASGSSGSCTGNSATVTNGVYTTNNLSVLAATTSAQLAGVISDETGSGSLVFATSPTLVTPALGTPASGVATNLTGTAASLTAGTVTTNANLTGGVTSVGNAATVITNANLTGDVTSSGNATTIATDAVDIAMLSATGTASSSTFLRGDNAWSTPVGSGDVSKVGTPVDSQVGVWTGDGTIEGTTSLVFDSTGLGIATAAPTSLLDVRGPTGTGAASAGVLTLATNELTIVDNDQLGRIEFRSPIATAGTDAIVSAAAIWAEANATFSASVNSADIVFATATSGAAAERLRITSDGAIGLGGANYGTSGQVLTSAGSAAVPTWTTAGVGTITGVTAGTNLNGGGSSGGVTLNLDNPVVADLTGNASGSSGSCTGNAATVTNGVYTTNNLSVLASTTSAQLLGVISDETGSGKLVFGTSPTLDGRVIVKNSSNSEVDSITSNGSGSIAIELNNSNNFSHTMTETTTLANPTSTLIPGQSGCIVITQDSGGNSYELSYGSKWHFEDGDSGALSTAADEVDNLVYYVASATTIHAVLLKNFYATSP